MLLGSTAFSQAANYDLPPGAQVIEVQPIQSSKYRIGPSCCGCSIPSIRSLGTTRMTSIPARRTHGGSHDSGPTRVSLVDPRGANHHQYHQNSQFRGQRQLRYPVPHRPGCYYHVAGVPQGKKRASPPSCGLRLQWRRPGLGIRLVECHRLHGTAHDLDRLQRGPRPGDPISRDPDRYRRKPKSTRTYLWVDYLLESADRIRPGFGNMPLITGREPGPACGCRSATAWQKRNSPASGFPPQTVPDNNERTTGQFLSF